MAEQSFADLISKALYHLDLAKKLFAQPNQRESAIRRIRASFNRCREAWLLQQGFTKQLELFARPYERDSLFNRVAPPFVTRKTMLLDEKLLFLHDGTPFHPSLFDGQIPAHEAWQQEALACVEEASLFIEFVTSGRELPLFRWEAINNYRPGQYLKQLNRIPTYMTSQGPKPDGWNWLLFRVLAVDERIVVVRNTYRRTITRLSLNSLWLAPSDLRSGDMETPFERRRAWFELHPEFRQTPLDPSFPSDFGYSRYFTCPCCGYPTMLTHPSYNLIEFDYDMGYYEICYLCDWADAYYADDGHDLDDKEENDPDFGYSLRQARQNFELYQCMFQPKDGVYFHCHSETRIFDIKRRIIESFDEMVGNNNVGKVYLLWNLVEKKRKSLLEALKDFENTHSDAYTTAHKDCEVVGRDFKYKWMDVDVRIQPGQWLIDPIDGLAKVIWTGWANSSFVAKTRSSKRTIRNIVWWTPADLPMNDVTAPVHVRRTWFDVRTENLRGHVTCPCCGYPTLPDERSFEHCYLCDWEDDRQQDDHNADEETGGPNGDYSLTQARRNFQEILCMFRAGDESRWLRHNLRPEVQQQKKLICGMYEHLITAEDEQAVNDLWSGIDSGIGELSDLKGV